MGLLDRYSDWFLLDLGRFQYRFEIQAKTAILIRSLSLYPNEYEAVFLPGTVFRVLEHDDQLTIMEEIVLQKLNARRAQLACWTT
jgi:hypothetical protein